MLLQRQARGRGFGTGALAALIDASFLILPVASLWVQYQPANGAAEHLCDRLGLQAVGDAAVPASDDRRVRSIRRVQWQVVRPCRDGADLRRIE